MTVVFSLSALWWRRIKGLRKLPDGIDWLRGKLGLVMGGAMFSKSLIQFSFRGWGCGPCLLLDLRPSYGGGNEENGDPLKKVPHLCQRLLDTHGHVCISLLWDHCSFLLDPGAHKVLFVPFKSLFPQSCVRSGGSTVGLMVTFYKRASARPRSAAPRAPVAGQCWPVPTQETLRHSSGSVSVGWACVLCPSQVQAAQATRSLASSLSQAGSVS